MREEQGEYIELIWDSEPSPVEYIKGHVDEAVARTALEMVGIEMERFALSHRYARWSFPSFLAPDGADKELKVYDAPARGRFKVTEVQRKAA